MCIVVGVTHPAIALVATDTRWGFTCTDRRVARRDLGGRLRAAPGGWCAWTGEAVLGISVLRELEEGACPLPAARSWLQTRTAALVPGILEEYPSSRPLQSCLVTSYQTADGTFCIGEIRADDSGEDHIPAPGAARCAISWPDGSVLGAVEADRRLFDGIGAANNLGDIVRAVGACFRWWSERAESMSGAVEVGLTIRDGARVHQKYLRGPAAWMESATEMEILRALQSPTKIPRDGLQLVEKIMFEGVDPETEVAACSV